MRCRSVQKTLAAFLAGECRPSEAAAVEKHLAACPACAAELDQLRHLNRMLDLWPAEPAPGGMWDAVMGEVEKISACRNPGRVNRVKGHTGW